MLKENQINSALFMTILRETLIEDVQEKNGDEKIIKYIKETASDANVLSFAMYGKISDVDDNAFVETQILNDVKQLIIENSDQFAFDDNYKAVDFMNEINSLSLEGIDSREILKEASISMELRDAWNAATKKYGETKRYGSEEEIKKAQEHMRQVNEKMESAYKKGLDEKNAAKVGSVGDKMKFAWKDFKSDASQGWEKFTRDVFDNREGIKDIVGISIVVAAAAYIGFKVYQRYFSKASKKCVGKKGAERKQCYVQVKIDALKKQIEAYEKGKPLCDHTKNPSKCKEKLGDKILKYKTKLKTAEESLTKLKSK